MAGKLQFMTINNLQEFLNLHNVQIDKKISDAVANSIKTVSQSEDGYTIYFYTKTAPVTIEDAVFTLSLPQPLTKIDKVKNAVEGNIPSLSKDGNLVDSGKSVTDFDAAGAADTAKAEVLGVVGTIPADATAKNVVDYIKEVVTAGAYDDKQIKADIAANKGAIDTLNGTGECTTYNADDNTMGVTPAAVKKAFGIFGPKAHTHKKSDITDFPTSLPASDVYAWAKASSKPSYSWGEITGKPSTFTPSSHTHDYITSSYRLTAGTTANRASGIRQYEIYNNGYPFTYGNVLQLTGSNGVSQIAMQWHGTGLAYRSAPDTSTTFSGWATILTSSNYSSYTVTKTGGGASGTWGINVTGSAGSVAWGNVSGRPSSLPASDVHITFRASANMFTIIVNIIIISINATLFAII